MIEKVYRDIMAKLPKENKYIVYHLLPVNLNYCFPLDHLGVADKMLYGRMIRQCVRKHDALGDLGFCNSSLQGLELEEAMRQFGFRPRERRTEGDRWLEQNPKPKSRLSKIL